MGIDELLSHFKDVTPNGRNRWKVLCPCHQDSKASLAVALGKNGRILLHCHAGCDVQTILDTISISMQALFESGETTSIRSRREEISPETARLRNEIYTKLLNSCGLSPAHCEDLRIRGFRLLSCAVNYKSLSLQGAIYAIKELRLRFNADEILSVPGFIKDFTGNIRPVRDTGLMIPVRNEKGQIIAIQLRTEDEDGKYKWFSASENSVGSPVHVPLACQGRSMDTIRITEGPLKADLTCELSTMPIPTIGIASVSTWKSVLPVLYTLLPKRILLAWDSDWRTKPQVKLSLNECFRQLQEEGFEVDVEVWDEKYKGIDDLLSAGGKPSIVGQKEIEPSLEEQFPEHAGIILLNASELQERPIEWFWNQWLPYGSFCTLDGDPNEGKSTLVSAFASHSTGGPRLPGTPNSGVVCSVGKSVVLIACEDDKNNTWIPRLNAAGCDTSLVDFWDGNIDEKERRWLPNLPADMRKLEYIIRKKEAGLVVIDPLYSFIDSKFDSWKDQHMKLVLNELTDLASRTGACIIGVRHLNKSATLPSLYRGLGSIGVIGVARSGLVVVRDETDEEIRYLCQVKNNLAKPQAPWKFRIDAEGGASRIVWLEQETRTLRELSQPQGGGGPASSAAAQFIVSWLGQADVAAAAMYQNAEKLQISKRTLDRAKAALGVKSYQEDSIWYWSMNNGKPK
jgi:AAA domain/Domain of unknown function (DUF3854)